MCLTKVNSTPFLEAPDIFVKFKVCRSDGHLTVSHLNQKSDRGRSYALAASIAGAVYLTTRQPVKLDEERGLNLKALSRDGGSTCIGLTVPSDTHADTLRLIGACIVNKHPPDEVAKVGQTQADIANFNPRPIEDYTP